MWPPIGWLVRWLFVGWLVHWSIRHAGFTEVMQHIWDGLTPNYLRSLYASMQCRTQMVIEAKSNNSVCWSVCPSIKRLFLWRKKTQTFHFTIDHP